MSALVSTKHLQILYRRFPKSVPLDDLVRILPMIPDKELPKFLCVAANKKIDSERAAYVALTLVQQLPAEARKQPAALSLLDRAFQALRKYRPVTIH